MKLLIQGLKEEIEGIRQMQAGACRLPCACSECMFWDTDCRLTRAVLEFLKDYADFIVKDDKKSDCSIGYDTVNETQEKIDSILGAITQLLKVKNSRYGNSILSPMRVFCKKDKEESDIPARLDDKLSRIKNSDKIRINDVTDLIGYLVLLLIQLGCTETDILNQID